MAKIRPDILYLIFNGRPSFVLLILMLLIHSNGCLQQTTEPNQSDTDDSLETKSTTQSPAVDTTTLLPIVDSSAETTTTSNLLDVAASTTTIPSLVTTTTTTQPTQGEQTTEEHQKNIPQPPIRCLDVNYCLNGGTCVLSATGQMLCLCPEGFYGARCQTRNICQTIITSSLTGDQICAKIGRECFKNDKFFRCSCHDDEYFFFKTNQPQHQSHPNKHQHQHQRHSPPSSSHSDRSIYDTTRLASLLDLTTSLPADTTLASAMGREKTLLSDELYYKPNEGMNPDDSSSGGVRAQPSYFAECRKIDKCLGIRCRRMSEVCSEGECICNGDAGYLRDPKSGLCKLLDPCLMPTKDGLPICGQAKCVATYDHDLYRCVCPVGYKALKVNDQRTSTECVHANYFTICDVPLLNKCQHICQIDRLQNHYKCSCFPGYRPGTREIDAHLCFFDEHVEQYAHNDPFDGRYAANPSSTSPPPHLNNRPSQDYVYKSYCKSKKLRNSTRSQELSERSSVGYNNHNNDNDYMTTTTPLPDYNDNEDDDIRDGGQRESIGGEIFIKRELRSAQDPTRVAGSQIVDEEGGSSSGLNINRLSAQERCNMYCEENKICVLEGKSTDSYRCVCDRQGYITIGDRCLDWCSAAEFSYKVRKSLDAVCLSGVCEQSSKDNLRPDNELARLERESSWRPTFECDCTSSPLLIKDQETKLCKLDFQAILTPCLPGNVGYIDCVENKNAYCAVLYKQYWSIIKDLQYERPNESSGNKVTESPDSSNSDRPKSKINEGKLYTCVCSPEKKFLVDKPRNKARCVDECELLNVECGRFNRMCRAATIAPDDFGNSSLVRMDPDGVRMNFKRTGCECLPGFNVGPSELVDFTLDDNNPSGGSLSVNPYADNYLQVAPIVQNNNEMLEETEHSRTKYMNINSRCLLDYDVVEFHASFKAPADFDPTWVKIRNPIQRTKPTAPPNQSPDANPDTSSGGGDSESDKFGDTIQENQPPTSGGTTTNGGQRDSVQENLTMDQLSDSVLKMPQFMKTDISEFHKSIVLVAQCDDAMAPLSLNAYQECIRYRYWIVQKLREHFVDWRRVITAHLSETFDLMEGNIRLHVNKCEATLRSASDGLQNSTRRKGSSKHKKPSASLSSSQSLSSRNAQDDNYQFEDPSDEQALVDADIDCELTLHSASDDSSPRYSRKVLLEKQLQKFIFMTPANRLGDHYYLMAPKTLIRRESFDQLAEHRQLFNPCKSDYAYCDKQTKCEMVDTVNFTCTCEYGYTPIGSRDIYYADSRKEVCEDINECLFDVCKELANVSTCINEIGDYRCQCNRHYTGDNKRFCTHVCNTIPCKHGRCRLVDDHHAFCECEEGYKETDCSVQDPNVALRKANMIICGSIFTSVLLLAVTLAISLNHQLKKTKRKLKKMESFNDAGRMIEFTHQQPPFRSRISSKVN